jgi:hypothetical protein
LNSRGSPAKVRRMSKNNSSSKKTVARSAESPAKRVRRASATDTTSVAETSAAAPAAETSAAAPAAATSAAVATVAVSHDQVAALAYRFFVEGGYQHGHALDHWLRAETALRAR